jgi:PBP1b-binding outer membrane lipoprotein LpoB|tara:strand:- start:437 stop:550 length:114 start_codon:yes stop_codon:yes gene_type:complete
MKIIFLLCIAILILEGCGKKSDPEYQSNFYQEKRLIF